MAGHTWSGHLLPRDLHTDQLLLLASAVAPPPAAPTATAPGPLAATVLHVLEEALTKATTRGEPGVLLPRAYPVTGLSDAECAALISAAGVKCKVEGKYARFTEQKLHSESGAESYTAKYGAPPPSKVADLFTCALFPEHAGKRPLQKAVWLVNNGADGAPHWVWVFEACAACQKCRRAAAAAKLEVKLEEKPPGAGTGGGGAQGAGVAPPAKRQKPAASNGASPAEATAVPAVPAAAPQAAVHAVLQAAVYICNAMDSLPDADRALYAAKPHESVQAWLSAAPAEVKALPAYDALKQSFAKL